MHREADRVARGPVTESLEQIRRKVSNVNLVFTGWQRNAAPGDLDGENGTPIGFEVDERSLVPAPAGGELVSLQGLAGELSCLASVGNGGPRPWFVVRQRTA